MNIPFCVFTDRGPALVVVRMESALWADLCARAVERLAELACKRAEYERARARHLACTERTYTAQLLARLC